MIRPPAAEAPSASSPRATARCSASCERVTRGSPAGRLVIPKALRDSLGLRPGAVEVCADGTETRVDVPAEDSLAERGGRLVIPASGTGIDEDLVRSLRDAGQR